MSEQIPGAVPSEPPASVRPGGSLTRTILRGAGIILIVTLAARIAGFVRYLVFGASVGAGDVGTAYATANMLPNVLFEIIAGGALAAVVVPLIAGLVGEGGRGGPDAAREADRIVSVLLTWTVLVTTALAVVVGVLAPQIAHLLLSEEGSGAAGVTIGTRLLRIFAVQLPLYGIAVILGAFLQARRQFLWPAMMPLISSLVVMASYRVYAVLVPADATTTTISAGAIAWLGWGTTAGVAAMALPVAVVSLRSGLRVRPALTLERTTARRALGLGAAGLGAVGAQQAVMALVMLLAMRTGGTGTLPVFQYAQALYLLPYAILVVPLVTAVFPQLSEMRLVGDAVGFARLTAASLRTVIVVSAVGAAMLIAAGPALEQFFRLMDRAGATGVGAATAALALGLPGFAIATHCTRVLSAALRSGDALLVGSLGWGVAALGILLMIVPAPAGSSATAATAFGLVIAVGMTLSALVALGRMDEVLEAGGGVRPVRRAAALAPVGLLAGAVPALLLCRLMVTVETSMAGAVLAGIAAGLLAAVITTGVLLLIEPALLRDLRSRLSQARASRVSSA